jgi:hypothetical protein
MQAEGLYYTLWDDDLSTELLGLRRESEEDEDEDIGMENVT